MGRRAGVPHSQPKLTEAEQKQQAEWLYRQYLWANDPSGPARWTVDLNLKNELGIPLEWKDHKFLLEPLMDMHTYQVSQKCAQIGLSTLEVLKALFAAQVLKWRVIYTLPTDHLAQEFSQTKIEPMLLQNPSLRPTGTDNAGSKIYKGAGYVLFRGTTGEQQDISLTADLVVNDEVDKSVQTVVEGLESRLKASKIAGIWQFTNPTVPGTASDKRFRMSDKREWHVQCRACNEEQPLDYWQNVDKERKLFVCRACREPLSDDDRRNGYWKATQPEINGNPPKWHGYHFSHLMAAWISAEDLIADEEEKTKTYFFNFDLGLPVIAGGFTVDTDLIMRAVVPPDDERHKQVYNQKFMGVDVGAKLHVVIGNEKGILKALTLGHDPGITSEERDSLDYEGQLRVSKWGKLCQLMNTEGINLCVIDNAPSEKQVDFQKAFPFKVLRCVYDYKDKRKENWEEDKKKGLLLAHRTRIIDKTIESYGTGDTLIFMEEKDPFLNGTGKQSMEDCLTKHWGSLYAVGADGSDENVVKHDRMGNVIRTWENAGPDHLAHSNVYYYLARNVGRFSGTGSGGFMPGTGGGPAPKRSKLDDDDDDDDVKPTLTYYGM